ncbi:MAG: D-2-hydroxyacid dehydrogenase [Woeseiaceae bacterium]
MADRSNKLHVVIGTPLEPNLVERIRTVRPERVVVLYEPDLLPPMRYRGDHGGDPDFRRSSYEEQRWTGMIHKADILWDIPPSHPDGGNVIDDAKRLKWIQTTSSGVGPRVQKLGLDRRGIVITTARGLHAGPLTEFTFMALLMHAKDYSHLKREQAARHWELYCTDSLEGKALSIVGMGGIGRRIAATGKAFGMRINGLLRDDSTATADDLRIDAVFHQGSLHDMLRETDALVLCAPRTAQTEGMMDRAALDVLKRGAVLVNIARGSLVDEPAMIAALLSGQLAFAALDVFAAEPLPAESPLWDLDNVLISPHSASTVVEENERITDLFCHNLRLFLEGRVGEMKNLFNVELGY